MSAVNDQTGRFEGMSPAPNLGRSIPTIHPQLDASEWRAIFAGGFVAGALDAADGVVAFYLAGGMSPIQVLQYIASGALGTSAFHGGLSTAALGAAFHFFIALVAAAVYVAMSRRVDALRAYPYLFGPTYGVGVYLFMNLVVLPLSAVATVPMTLGLLLNGLIGHAIFVGLPIALAAQRAAKS